MKQNVETNKRFMHAKEYTIHLKYTTFLMPSKLSKRCPIIRRLDTEAGPGVLKLQNSILSSNEISALTFLNAGNAKFRKNVTSSSSYIYVQVYTSCET